MWTIKHHEEFEKQICSKCPANINRDYTPCAKCKRAQDFEAGFEACKKARLNITTISDNPIKDEYTLPKDLLGLWEQTICEIRAEIKAQETPALVYAKELCDKLEHSMCALAGGPYDLRYSIEEEA